MAQTRKKQRKPPARTSAGPSRRAAQSNRRARALSIAIVVVLVLAMVLAFVRCGGSSTSAKFTDGTVPPGFDAGIRFNIQCAGCHGANGRGSTGPQLSNGAVVRKFPTVDDELKFVENGKGIMPAFKNIAEHNLNEAELRAIVVYTRTLKS